jgi:hypothetical protein
MSDAEIFNVGVVDEYGMFHEPVMYQNPKNFSTHMTAGTAPVQTVTAGEILSAQQTVLTMDPFISILLGHVLHCITCVRLAAIFFGILEDRLWLGR